jgi:hypothetical protein
MTFTVDTASIHEIIWLCQYQEHLIVGIVCPEEPLTCCLANAAQPRKVSLHWRASLQSSYEFLRWLLPPWKRVL